MHDDRPEVPQHVVVTAFLLAAVSLIVPLAVVGALFAALVLAQRGRPREAVAVVALAVACAAVAVSVL